MNKKNIYPKSFIVWGVLWFFFFAIDHFLNDQANQAKKLGINAVAINQ